MTKDELKALAEALSKLAKARGCTGVVVGLSASDGTDCNCYVQHGGVEARAIARAAVLVVEGKPAPYVEIAGRGGGGAGAGYVPTGATGGNRQPLRGGAGGVAGYEQRFESTGTWTKLPPICGAKFGTEGHWLVCQNPRGHAPPCFRAMGMDGKWRDVVPDKEK